MCALQRVVLTKFLRFILNDLLQIAANELSLPRAGAPELSRLYQILRLKYAANRNDYATNPGPVNIKTRT